MANRKASGVVKDALNLSNLGNTAFASHKELTEYINDGFTSLYNELINKGNDYWLKEAYVASSMHGDYYLPTDFYRAKNLSSGHYLIPRKSNSGSGYSIRNGMLHIDCPAGNIKLEYYPTPTYISFPSSDLDLPKELISLGDNTHTWNEYVVGHDKIVTNIETKETYDLSALVNDIFGIGNGYVISTDSHGDKQLYDFNGNEIGMSLQGSGYFILGSSGNPYAMWYDNGDDVSNIWPAIIDSEGPFMTFSGRNDFVMMVNDVDENVPGIWYVEPGENDTIKAWHFMDKDGNDYSVDAGDLNTWGTFRFGYCPDWSDNSFYVSSGNKIVLLSLTEKGLEMVEYKIPSIMNVGLVRYNDSYYFLTGDFLGCHLKGYEPDTLMEYPTNVFYRALSSYIAIQLLAKQGADTTNMQASFASLVDTLTKAEDSSADYPVIKNFY